MKVPRTWILIAFLAAVAATYSMATPSVWAQAPEKKESPQLTVYQLRHTDCQSAAEALRQLLGTDADDGVKIAAHLTTNLLLVQAAARQQEMVGKLLERIDVEAPQGPAMETKIFPLQHARADELSEVLEAVADRHDVRLAIDQRTNAIVANGRPEALTTLFEVLESLDVPPPGAKRPLPLHVRIVWLVEGREEGKLPAPFGDLRDVVEELTTLGFEDLGRASQILIHVDSSQARFEAAGNAAWGGDAFQLSVEGARVDFPSGDRKEPADGKVRLNLSITVTQQGGKERLCSLNTDLTTPLEHSTVLGTTPLGQKSSVFVVQVLRPEN